MPWLLIPVKAFARGGVRPDRQDELAKLRVADEVDLGQEFEDLVFHGSFLSGGPS